MSEDNLKLVAMVFGALFAISEVLAAIPAVKANSVFGLIYSALKKIVEFLKKTPAA